MSDCGGGMYVFTLQRGFGCSLAWVMDGRIMRCVISLTDSCQSSTATFEIYLRLYNTALIQGWRMALEKLDFKGFLN